MAEFTMRVIAGEDATALRNSLAKVPNDHRFVERMREYNDAVESIPEGGVIEIEIPSDGTVTSRGMALRFTRAGTRVGIPVLTRAIGNILYVERDTRPTATTTDEETGQPVVTPVRQRGGRKAKAAQEAPAADAPAEEPAA